MLCGGAGVSVSAGQRSDVHINPEGDAQAMQIFYNLHDGSQQRVCHVPCFSSRSEQVCLASSDLLHTHLALAGTCYSYHHQMPCACAGVMMSAGQLSK